MIIKLVLFLILLPVSASATTWFARTDGAASPTCNGQSNASAASSPNCAFASLQEAINAAQYGDTIIARAGDTWNQISIPTKSGSPSTITVKSSGEASIPVRQHGVINTDAANMAKIATTQNNFALQIASGRSNWNFIGFEITTANRSQYYTILVEHQGSNVNFDRCWIHSLEDYTNNPEASVRIGLNYSGSNSSITNSRIAYFSAYVLGTTIVDNNFAVLYSGSTLAVSNSYLGAWFQAIISGGSSFAPAVAGVTVSGSPTTTTATVSTTSGLSVGMLAAFRNYPQRTLTNACSFVASSRTLTCTGGNFNAAYKDLGGAGTPAFFFPNLGASTGVETVVNSTTLILQGNLGGSNFSNQTVDIDGVYGAVKITNISGNNLTYTPWGITALQAAPEVPGNVQWNGFVPNNLTMTRTMFYNNPTIQASVFATTGSNPKAFWEIKAVNGLVVDGCVFTGFGTSWGFLVANQGTPAGCPSVWTTVTNVTLSNNWYNTDANQFQIMGFQLTDNYYCTSMGGSNINVYNNLFTSGAVIARLVGGTNVAFRHNTGINNDLSSGAQLIQQEAGGPAGDTLNFNYSDNIAYQNTYGIHCSYGPAMGCFPSATIGTNLFIGTHESDPWCGSGYPAGNICVANQSAVKFINSSINNYQLAFDSPGKGTGSGSTDMGVIWSQLVNGLGFDPSGATSPVVPPRIHGRATVFGRARVGE